jgi:serine/threonine-protein kinase
VGEAPYTGPTAQAIVAKIVTEEAKPVAQSRKTVPAHVDLAIRKALAKLPADRFETASDFIYAIMRPGSVTPTSTTGALPVEQQRHRRRTVVAIAGWVLAVLSLIVIAYGALLGRRDRVESAVLHLSITLPDSAPLAFTGPAPGIWQRALAVSRNSAMIAYVAPSGSSTRLHVRSLGDRSVRAIPGTEGAYHPFFSPDGEWIGFFAGLELKKVHVSGGQPIPLAQDLLTPTGASWADDGRILVADHEGRRPTWIPAAGGAGEVVDTVHSYFQAPEIVPGGKWAVGTLAYSGTLALLSLEDATLYAITREGLRTDSIEPQDRLVGYNPVYAPTGHLVYLSPGDGVLMAVPFDAERGDVLGDPAPVMTGVRKEETYGFGHFAIGDDGTLIYAPGGNADIGYLAFLHPSGRVDTLAFPRALYESIHLSPDGQRVAVSIRSELGVRTPHVLDLVGWRQEPLRATGVPNAWSATGEELVLAQRDLRQLNYFANISKVVYSLTDGSTRPLDLIDAAWVDLARNADLIAWNTRRERNIFVGPFRGEGDPVRMPEEGGQVSLSPDGDWLAYLRPAAGTVRLSPYPPTGQVIQVSDGRGEQPRWTSGGDRLIYRDGRRFFEVDVPANPGSALTSPRLLAEGAFVRVWSWTYDVSPDGRLLVVLGPPERSVGHLNLVTNFSNELNRLAPRD